MCACNQDPPSDGADAIPKTPDFLNDGDLSKRQGNRSLGVDTYTKNPRLVPLRV